MADTTEAPRKLKNKRLSQYNREELVRLAKRRVEETEPTEALDNAYHLAAQAIRAAVEKRFPPKDMAILKRYDAASEDQCVYIANEGYRYEQFCFRDGDKAPLRAGRGGCHRNPFMLDPEARDAFEAFTLATKAREDAVKKRVETFKALIFGVNTFNEVSAVWPEAEALREAIVGSGSSLVVLSEDVVASIKADPAFAMAA